MERRRVIYGVWAGLVAVVGGTTGLRAVEQVPSGRSAPAARPIQLHCDLAVDPRREADVVRHVETVFKPTAARQTGYIDVKLNRLRTGVRGSVPPGGRFRFVLTFQSEELRQTWIASADHQQVWPPIEDMLTDKEFGILVYDVN